jgi:sirohydrochlorin cobaltochelatase
MNASPACGILLFAHGARDPRWAEPFHRMIAKLHDRHSDIPAQVAFLEHMEPDLETAIGRLAAQGVERITLLPLFMGRGGHLQRDLPQLVARACEAHPGVVVRTTEALGEVEALLEAITSWVLDEHDTTGSADPGYPVA